MIVLSQLYLYHNTDSRKIDYKLHVQEMKTQNILPNSLLLGVDFSFVIHVLVQSFKRIELWFVPCKFYCLMAL